MASWTTSQGAKTLAARQAEEWAAWNLGGPSARGVSSEPPLPDRSARIAALTSESKAGQQRVVEALGVALHRQLATRVSQLSREPLGRSTRQLRSRASRSRLRLPRNGRWIQPSSAACSRRCAGGPSVRPRRDACATNAATSASNASSTVEHRSRSAADNSNCGNSADTARKQLSQRRLVRSLVAAARQAPAHERSRRIDLDEPPATASVHRSARRRPPRQQVRAPHGGDAQLVGRDAERPPRVHHYAIGRSKAQRRAEHLRRLSVGSRPCLKTAMSVKRKDELARPAERGVDRDLLAPGRERDQPLIVTSPV